jgi:hypothetical protein
MYNYLRKVFGALGSPKCSKSAKFGQNLPLFIQQPAQNNKQKESKDGQKHFKSVFGY